MALWGGLVPPAFQDKYHGGNAAALAFVLSLFGVFGAFAWPVVVPGLGRLWASHRGVLLVVVGLGLVAGLLPETSYDKDAGRYSGLWNLARIAPVIADRSPVLWLGAAAGSAVLASIVARVGWRSGWILLARSRRSRRPRRRAMSCGSGTANRSCC